MVFTAGFLDKTHRRPLSSNMLEPRAEFKRCRCVGVDTTTRLIELKFKVFLQFGYTEVDSVKGLCVTASGCDY